MIGKLSAEKAEKTGKRSAAARKTEDTKTAVSEADSAEEAASTQEAAAQSEADSTS